MGKYSIKDLERLSGIKAHTIRIWEQRFNIVSPTRTDTNIRTYSDKDLRRILNISLLNRNGYKISSIARMSDDQLRTEVLQVTESDSDFESQINALVIAMVEMNEARFEKIISTNTLRIGFERTMVQVIYPFLHQIGIMWLTGSVNPAQEHFISNLIRQKIIVAIDGQSHLHHAPTKKFVLFLPEGEIHEMPLLFTNYLLKARKFNTIYLGISVPFEDIKYVAQINKPDYLFTILTTQPELYETQEYLNLLSKTFKSTKIFVAGHELLNNEYTFPKNIIYLDSIDAVLTYLEKLQNNSDFPFSSGSPN